MKNKNNFLIGNEIIERKISEFHAKGGDSVLSEAFEAIRKRMNQDAHIIIPIRYVDDGGFFWQTLNYPDIGTVLVAFTSKEEAEKGPKSEFLTNYIFVQLENAMKSVDFEGVILNPWGEPLFLGKDVMSQMFEINEKLGDGRRLVVLNDSSKEQCAVEVPEKNTVSDFAELEGYYQYALDASANMPVAYIPAVKVEGMEISEAAFVAAQFIFGWVDSNPDCDTRIVLFCSDEEAYESYDTAARVINAQRAASAFELEEMRKNRVVARKSDWQNHPMPDCRVELSIERFLSDRDKEVLRYGNVPDCMEDKWFWYVEDEILYAHRSWSGDCIYMIELSGEHDPHQGSLRVIINHDMEQHPWTVLDDAVEDLNNLLNWWVEPKYDYYGEWLDETARAIEKQNNSQEEADDDVETEVEVVVDAGAAGESGTAAGDKAGADSESDAGIAAGAKAGIAASDIKDGVTNNSDKKLIIKRPDYLAAAVERNKKFVVLKGSTINPKITGVMPPKALEMREFGLEKGFITDKFELTEDVVFSSSSAAAAFVVGHTVSGPKTWKEEKPQT